MNCNVAKPLVAAVNGYAGGAGFYLATRAVDFVVAARSASFQIAEVPRGILHGWQTGYWANLPRAAARELAFGFRISGRRAYDMGLANAYAEDDEQLMPSALAAARHIGAMPQSVILTNRELLKRLENELPPDVAADGRAAYLSLLERAGAGDREFLERRGTSAPA
ncbi:enoyl-CoA hydratase/isomerase family protein [Thermocatellispora tengchongensis]